MNKIIFKKKKNLYSFGWSLTCWVLTKLEQNACYVLQLQEQPPVSFPLDSTTKPQICRITAVATFNKDLGDRKNILPVMREEWQKNTQ